MNETSAVHVVAADRSIGLCIAEALEPVPGLVVTTSKSIRALLTEKRRCSLLVFSSDSVSGSDLTLLSEVRTAQPELLVVVVCGTADARSARRAVDKGVEGLVFTHQIETAIVPTVVAVLAGQIAVPRDLRASVRRPYLSSREKQVLSMVVMGFTNGEIGGRLYLAESTVKSHLSSAFSKLGVRSRSEATAMILDPDGPLGTGILAITDTGQKPAEQQSR